MNNRLLSGFFADNEKAIQFLKGWLIVLIIIAVILMLLGVSPVISIFIVLAIISMYPMRFVKWLGIELCLFFTVFSAMVYGVAAGIIVGKVANTAGMILSDQLDHTIAYDFVMLLSIAIISSFFSVQYITPVGIAMLLLYHIGFAIYHKSLDTYDSDNVLYTVTNILFNLMIFWRFGPILAKFFM